MSVKFQSWARHLEAENCSQLIWRKAIEKILHVNKIITSAGYISNLSEVNSIMHTFIVVLSVFGVLGQLFSLITARVFKS